MRMTRQVATFIHVLMIFVQFANAAGLLVPPQYKSVFALVVAGAQGMLGWFQHNFNPDGTPATVSYIPK